MYEYIKGILKELETNFCIVEVSGMGHYIHTPIHLFHNQNEIEKEILLHTVFIVREDSMRLFGFETKEEKSLFEKLITISGLGPKTALAIIGGSTSLDLHKIIQEKDTVKLTKIPGIGKKTAERIIIELADKLPKIARSSIPNHGFDAINALITLGYKEHDASKRVSTVINNNSDISLSELIKLSLK